MEFLVHEVKSLVYFKIIAPVENKQTKKNVIDVPKTIINK